MCGLKGKSLAAGAGDFPFQGMVISCMKLLKFVLLLSLILLPVDSHPQSLGARPIISTDDLVPALLETKNEMAALSLLKANKDSITPYLWNRLMDETINSTARTLFLLEMAKQVAEQLEDKRRLGIAQK